jgi:hypothetical protein
MKVQFKYIFILWLITILISSGSTGYLVYNYIDKPVEKEKIYVDKIITKTITRTKYITLKEAKEHLNHYDNDPFLINWKILSQRNDTLNVNIKGSLYQREFSQDAHLPIYTKESGNWKFAFGMGTTVVAIGAGAYLYYKLKK